MVLTKYKSEEIKKSEPKKDISISEWLKDMAEQGFDGIFVATNNDGRVYKGAIALEGGEMRVTSKKIPTSDEVKNRLQQLKNNGIV